MKDENLLQLAKIVADLAMACAAASPPARRNHILGIRDIAIELIRRMESGDD